MTAMPLPDPDYQAEFYAGVTLKRGLAWLIDTVLTAILTALILPFTAFTGLFFLPVLYAVVNFLYRWVTLSRSSATPGMQMVAIEFRRGDGGYFDAGIALLHTVGYVLSMAFLFPQLLSIALMIFGGRGQGLTDLVLNTAAINRPSRW
ncbi:MAG: RDD family protein [Pseudorhodobacter sp.]